MSSASDGVIYMLCPCSSFSALPCYLILTRCAATCACCGNCALTVQESDERRADRGEYHTRRIGKTTAKE